MLDSCLRRNVIVTSLIAILNFVGPVAWGQDSPSTVDEGNVRLSKLLGRLTDPVKLSRFKIDEEIETHPTENGPTVLIVNKGEQFTTNPSVRGESVVFTETELIVRNVFNLSADGKRTLNRHLHRTYTLEIALTRFPQGEWVVAKRMLNHSLPRYNAYLSSGSVRWLENGIEFRTTGIDSFYTPDGKTKLAAYLSVERYVSQDGRLSHEETTSMYEMAQSPDGASLLIPDLTRPLGKPMTSKRFSELRQD